MIETVLVVEALAIVATRVLTGVGDDYLKGKLQPLLKALKGKKQKKSPAAKALTESYERLCQKIGGILELQDEDPLTYKDDLEKFIKDPDVLVEFLKPFDAAAGTVTINDEFLAGKWTDLGLKRLPDAFPWGMIAQAYANFARQKMTTTPELQGIAQLQELTAIRQELRKGGTVVHDQDLPKYRDYVRSYYRVLDLSALAPA
ncbi:MAG: hypothetical protein IIC02_04375, partial [Planctomycetes bacterium]|nr:hypothetical protein [Planctomycetota bacterium]